MDEKKVGLDALTSLKTNAATIVDTLGRGALHAIAPDNFEYYSCSLTLYDSSLSVKGMLTFAVMPDNIMETATHMVNITKTNSGVVTNFNSTFVIRNISIQGTFGRKLRLIFGVEPEEEGDKKTWFGKFVSSGNLGFNMLGGQPLIKTGYGLVKFLKRMVTKLYELDENNKPYMMVFTNYAFNTSYVVEVLQSSFSQSVQNNMMWYYNLEMKAVAPASALSIDAKKDLWKKVAANGISKGISGLLSDVTKSLMQF